VLLLHNYGKTMTKEVIIRQYQDADLPQMTSLWNEVVAAGNAFPQEEQFSLAEAKAFFAAQSHSAVAEYQGTVVGLYILHPNNVGRCGHLANASYAVTAAQRGLHIGEKLVLDSLSVAKRLDFRVLQFNAVVKNNAAAIHLYDKLGFTQLGVVPGGFRTPEGNYEDIILFYRQLADC